MALFRNEKLTISSKIENLNLVQKFIEDICDEFNVNNNYFGNILVAVTSAVENAIKHGNQNSPEKKVDITFESKPNLLVFSVKDEGQGFNYTELPNPVENNIDENHNGIYLIKKLSDEVTFSDNGSKIEINFSTEKMNDLLSTERMVNLAEYNLQKEDASHKKEE